MSLHCLLLPKVWKTQLRLLHRCERIVGDPVCFFRWLCIGHCCQMKYVHSRSVYRYSMALRKYQTNSHMWVCHGIPRWMYLTRKWQANSFQGETQQITCIDSTRGTLIAFQIFTPIKQKASFPQPSANFNKCTDWAVHTKVCGKVNSTFLATRCSLALNYEIMYLHQRVCVYPQHFQKHKL